MSSTNLSPFRTVLNDKIERSWTREAIASENGDVRYELIANLTDQLTHHSFVANMFAPNQEITVKVRPGTATFILGSETRDLTEELTKVPDTADKRSFRFICDEILRIAHMDYAALSSYQPISSISSETARDVLTATADNIAPEQFVSRAEAQAVAEQRAAQLEQNVQTLSSEVGRLTHELTGSNERNDELTGQNLGQQADLTRLRGAVEQLSETTVAAEQNAQNLGSELDNVQGELATAQASLSATTQTIAALETQVAELQNELISREDNVGDLTSQLEAATTNLVQARSEKANLSLQLGTLQTQLNKLQEAKNGADEKVTSLSTQLQTANAKTEELEGRNATLRADLQQANSSTEALTTQLQAAQKELATQTQSADAKTGELEGQIATLQADLQRANSANTNAETKREALTTQLQAAHEELATQARSVDAKTGELKDRISALQTSLQQADDANASSETERQTLTAQLKAARRELAIQAQSVDAKTGELEEQIATLQADLQRTNSANTNAETEREALTAQLQAAHEELATQAQSVDAKTGELEGQIATLQADLQRANSANTNAETERQTLTTQLQAAREALATQAQSASAKTGELESRITALQASLQQAKDANASSETQREALTAQLQAANAKTEGSEGQLASVTAELTETRAEVAAAREKASDLEATLILQASENMTLYELLDGASKDITALEEMFQEQVEGLKAENRDLADLLQKKEDELKAASNFAREQGELVGGLLTEMEAQKGAHRQASRKLNEAALERVRNFEPQASEKQTRRLFQELESVVPSTINYRQMIEQMRIIRDQNATLSARTKEVEAYARELKKTNEATQVALAVERKAHESTRANFRNKSTTRVVPGKHGLQKKLKKARPGRTINPEGVIAV